jgi:uncharacterized protein DUF4349
VIDEVALHDVLGRLGDEIVVPADGAARVVDAARRVAPRPRRRTVKASDVLAIAAVIVVVLGLGAVVVVSGNSSENKNSSGDASSVQSGHQSLTGGAPSTAVAAPLARPNAPPEGVTGNTQAANQVAPPPADAAKIVKTGSVDLQLAHGTLRATTNRVTAIAVGAGGYVAESKTSYGGAQPTAEMTIRVPVGAFESAIARLGRMPGVKVLAENENGADVTAQYTDLQAQLRAATTERDSLLVVLSRAESIGDILAVRDRVTAVQREVDQLQGRINLLGDQAAFSSIAVSLTEKPRPGTPVHEVTPPTGISKAWHDARDGFSNAIEWLLARSGGALVVLLALLALVFGVRYLYPVVRRGLM